MKIGIMPIEQQKERTLAIARGEYKPTADEPKVWFSTMASLAQVLSDENQALIRTIAEQNPETVTALAKMTGRAISNLSRTLHNLERYGLVSLRKEKQRIIPEAKATAFDIKTGDWGFMSRMQTKGARAREAC